MDSGAPRRGSLRVPLRRRTDTCLCAEFDVGARAPGLTAGWLPECAPEYSLAVLFAPGGALRYNKWLRGDELLALGLDAAHTGLGGVPGELEPGRWTLLLFTPPQAAPDIGDLAPQAVVRIGEPSPAEPLGDGCAILTDGTGLVRPVGNGAAAAAQRGLGWYKGDFHAHTRLSDGKESVASAIEKAARMGLDFYTPTEHNVIHTAWPGTPPLALPGIEVTSEKGHFNIIGLKELPSDFFAPDNMDGGFVRPERMTAILAESRRSGAINSLNHPFLCEWKWDIPDTPFELFHTVEIICDPTYPYSRDGNERALEFWTRLWNDGKIIYGIGGSDSHNLEHERYDGATEPSIPGDPASWVYCESFTCENLVCGVKAGHVCVCRRGGRLMPKFTAGGVSYLPGANIRAQGGTVSLTCSLRAEGVPEGAMAQWIVNGETRAEAPLNGEAAVFSAQADTRHYTWARVDIRDADGALYGFTNPV
ncbi:MAG: CehA/McbA family metallohydrolase, partial [Oscillospiraceae bacterium]|nr:CehA/McbA family metallohydrolase [Oscillospiraceae bacterium]